MIRMARLVSSYLHQLQFGCDFHCRLLRRKYFPATIWQQSLQMHYTALPWETEYCLMLPASLKTHEACITISCYSIVGGANWLTCQKYRRYKYITRLSLVNMTPEKSFQKSPEVYENPEHHQSHLSPNSYYASDICNPLPSSDSNALVITKGNKWIKK